MENAHRAEDRQAEKSRELSLQRPPGSSVVVLFVLFTMVLSQSLGRRLHVELAGKGALPRAALIRDG